MNRITKYVGLVLLSGALLAPATLRFAQAAEDTPLAKQMEEMQSEYKALRKNIKDSAQTSASLEAVSKFQAAVIAAKPLLPAKAAKVPEADKAKFLAGYRKDMAGLLEHLCKIEVALLDNDNAKAEDLFKGLKKIEDAGHEKYTDE